MMKLDDLKNAWQSESGISPERFEQIGRDVQNSTQRLQSVIFRRDMLETFASIIVIAAFAAWMFAASSSLARLGCAIIVIAGLVIPSVLWWARRREIQGASETNFRQFVDVEVEYLRRQSLIIRNVGVWYLLPIYVGMVLIVVGLVGLKFELPELVGGAILLVFGAWLYWYLWRMNQTAREKHLDPMLRYYQRMQSALLSGEGFDELDAGPPADFLKPGQRQTITWKTRWVGGAIAMAGIVVTVLFGLALVFRFDPRTGWFVLSTSPVVALLLFVCSGACRPIEKCDQSAPPS